jgi:hypothetical protein
VGTSHPTGRRASRLTISGERATASERTPRAPRHAGCAHSGTWSQPTCSTRDGARRARADLPPGATTNANCAPLSESHARRRCHRSRSHPPRTAVPPQTGKAGQTGPESWATPRPHAALPYRPRRRHTGAYARDSNDPSLRAVLATRRRPTAVSLAIRTMRSTGTLNWNAVDGSANPSPSRKARPC